jgi:alpha-glucosidase (family GH31 glycosyl hydrolase)
MGSIQVLIHQEPCRLQFQKEGKVILNLSVSNQVNQIDQEGNSYQISFSDSSLDFEISDQRIIFNWQGKAITAKISVDTYWFGMGNLVHQRWPLNQLMLPLSDFITSDTGVTGLSTLVSPAWLTDNGLAIIVESPVKVGLNQPPPKLVKRHAAIPGEYIPFDRRPWFDKNKAGDKHLTLSGDDLHFEVLVADDLVTAFDALVKEVGHPQKTPPLELMAEPIWTTWARYKDKIDQVTVLGFAREIIDHDYPYQVMEIDDRWQIAYGDFEFDPERFPDPKKMVDELHALGFKVTLWIIPYLHPQSKAAKEGAAKGYLVKNAGGEPYKIKWWQGAGYLLDVTNPDAMAWFDNWL